MSESTGASRNIRTESYSFFATFTFPRWFLVESCSRSRADRKKIVFDVKWKLNTRSYRREVETNLWDGTFFHFSFPFFSSLSSLLNSDVLTNERYLNIDKKRKTARGGSDLSCQDGGGREERIVRMHQVEYACTFISVWRRRDLVSNCALKV